MIKKIVAILALVWFVSTSLIAQENVTTKPYSFTHDNISLDIDKVELSALNVSKLMEEDALNTDKSTPLRVGIARQISYTMNNSGRTDHLADGSMLWRLEITSPEAILMDFTLTAFNIPEGATLQVYSPDQEQVTEAYTNADIQNGDLLVTDDIIGDKAVIEYYEPANVPFHGSFEVSRIGHIYKDFLNIAPDSKGHWGSAEGDCHYNVVCPEGDNWRDQIKAVVLLRMSDSQYEYLCSGAMINNTRMDKTPYVLTAEHCRVAGGTYKYYFNYQTSTCDGTTGFFNRSASGGEIVAMGNLNTSSDFMLMKITGELKETYRDSIVFAGWDATGAASVGAAIHHPGGDYKKISIPKSIYSYGGQTNKYWTVKWCTNPNKGTTEQGSSGSPLFNANGLIIGDLSNGSSSCDYPQGVDNYGKFSHSWLNNNTSINSKKLQPWLDPDNTGVKTCQAMKYDGTVVGIENHAQFMQPFTVIPNPSTGKITIEGNFDSVNGVCHVYNAMGSLVDSRQVSLMPSFSMSLQLPNGIYFMEIIGNDHIYKSKIVIAK